MIAKTTTARESDPVKQFSVFTANRLGRLRDLTSLLASRDVHILALTVIDATDSAIIRLVTDDPDHARELFVKNEFPFTESNLLVVEFDSAVDLNKLMTALLEAEININYLYSFIPNPNGKPLIGLSIEDNDIAAKVLQRHQFHILKQSDISR
jgi:hypothetical protein